MYTSTFTFRKGEYDDEFYRLDAIIASVAREIPGYVGEESWENSEKGLISTVYYWETMEALLQLVRHPAHIEAKGKQAKWIDGFHIVIAQVVKSYGDGGIDHPMSRGASLVG